jgi:hypothetical protein
LKLLQPASTTWKATGRDRDSAHFIASCRMHSGDGEQVVAGRETRRVLIVNRSQTLVYSAMKSMPIFSHKKAPDDAGAFETLIFAQISTGRQPGHPS